MEGNESKHILYPITIIDLLFNCYFNHLLVIKLHILLTMEIQNKTLRNQGNEWQKNRLPRIFQKVNVHFY